MSRWLTRWLGAAVVVSIGLNIFARLPKTYSSLEYMPNMARTARYNAFEENPNFADGMTLRAPVPGTVPRGLPPLTEDSLSNPFAADDRAAVDRGAVIFSSFCQPCHGQAGQGDGLVVMHGFPQPPPLTRGQTQRKTDAQLFQILTNGQNTMPSYATQVSRDDRWRAILFLRTLKSSSRSDGDNAK